MAKKKDIFDDLDDINLDEFDFGGDLGLDDLSFGGGSRTPIQKLRMSFRSSAREKTTSLDFHLRNLKRILPKEYSGALEMIEHGRSSTASLYGKTLEKIRPLSNDLREFAKGISPAINKVLPRNIRDKLKAWADSADESYSSEDGESQESIIGKNLQEIFAVNLRENVVNAAHQRKYQGFKDKVSHLRHMELTEIFKGIHRGISRLAGYNDKITFKWQRKTLELQYRHYYQNEKLIDRVTKGNELIVKALAAITRNTGLPDALKIEMKEMLGYETKQAVIRKLQSRTFGGVGKIADRITTNLGKKIDEIIDTAGMVTGSMSLAGSMAGTGAIDPSRMAADSIIDQLAALGGGRLNGVLGRNSRIRGLGARLHANISSARGYAEHRGQRSPLWRLINDLMSEEGDDLKIKSSSESLTAPAVIDNQVKKTWITVIPGLLSRILREIAVLRTGDERTGLVKYNFDKDRFIDNKRSKTIINESLRGKGGGSHTRDSVKRVMEQLDPDNKLTNSQKAIIRRRIMDNAMRGESFYAESFLDASKYEASDDRKDIASIIKFMRNEYKAGRKVRIGENYDIDTKRSKIAELTRDLGLYVNDLIRELDRQLLMGHDEELEELGFIKVGRYGSEWDKVKIRQFLLEELAPDIPPAPNDQRDRNERIRANAEEIRRRARSLFERMIERTRRRLDRSSGSLERIRRSDAGRRTEALARLTRRRLRRGNNAGGSGAPSGGPSPQDSTSRISAARRQATQSAQRSRRYYRNLNVLRNGINRESVIADLRAIQSDVQQSDTHADAIAKIEIVEAAINRSIGGTADSDIQAVREALRAVRESLASRLIAPNDNDSEIIRKLEEAKQFSRQYKSLIDEAIRRLNRTEQVESTRSRPGRSTRSRSTEDSSDPYTSQQDIRRGAREGARRYHRNSMEQLRSQGPQPIPTQSNQSELIDIQNRMLEIQTKLLEANIAQVRLLEGGLHVNGIEVRRGGLYRGLRAGAGKLISGGAGMVKSIFGFYSGILGALTRGATGAISGAFGLGGRVLGRLTGNIGYSDIYVRGNPRHPILLARDLRAGIYRNKLTGKVIKKLKDITGPVIDADGNEVVSADDINKGLYDIQGRPILKTLANKAINFYGALLAPVVTVAKIANWAVKKTFGLVTRDRDVYVSGETSPRLLARVLQMGGYISAVTGRPIYSVREIDGDVMDTSGEHVILSVSELGRLVDRQGNPYRTAGEKFRDIIRGGFKYTIGLPIKMAWKMAKGSVKLGYNLIKKGAGLLSKIFKGFGMSSRRVSTTGAYSDLVAKNPDLLINVHQNEILLSMLELLNTRLPNIRPRRGDSDGDGHRDGSWQERIEALRSKSAGTQQETGNRKRRKAGASEETPPENSRGGFLSSLFGGRGGLGALLSGGGKLGLIARLLGGAGLGALTGGLLGGEGGDGEGISGTTLAAGAAGAGLLAAPAATLRAIRGAGSLGVRGLLSGGGMLARGAMMAGPLLATAATGLIAAISSPVVLTALGVAAVGAGSYYLYKKYFSDKAVFLPLRMAQYGVLPDEKDRVEKILELEDLLKDNVRINGGDATITLNKKTLTKMAAIFGITHANKEAMNGWAIWVNERFKPVFLKHSLTAFKYFGKTDVSLLEDKLEPYQKVDVVKSLAIPDTGTNYLKMYSPFGSELNADYSVAEMILNKSAANAKENEGGNFISRWWKNTFGTPAPKTNESGAPVIPMAKIPGAENKVDPKTAYSDMVKEAKAVSNVGNQGYRRLGEHTANTLRKPFNETTSGTQAAGVISPAPATPSNVARTFPKARTTTYVPDPGVGGGGLFLPVGGRVSSGFGLRTAPTAGASSNHKGIDIAAANGTPVVAMTAGVIIKRERQGGYGNIVYIQHAGGVVTKYAHLSRFQQGQEVGTRVGGGQVIGYVGATGTATGPHLHFEIVGANGQQLDPEQYLKGNQNASRGPMVPASEVNAQSKRFEKDDITSGDAPPIQTPDTQRAANPLTKNATPVTSGGKVFNPTVTKPATPKPTPVASNEPKRNVVVPTQTQQAIGDQQTYRMVKEQNRRAQVTAQHTVESSRVLSELLEINKSMLGHLASIDRKTGGTQAPQNKVAAVENPVSMKSKQNLGA